MSMISSSVSSTPKLEFRVRDDDPARRRMGGTELVNEQARRDATPRPRSRRPPRTHEPRPVDVFIMAGFGLAGGGKDRLGQRVRQGAGRAAGTDRRRGPFPGIPSSPTRPDSRARCIPPAGAWRAGRSWTRPASCASNGRRDSGNSAKVAVTRWSAMLPRARKWWNQNAESCVSTRPLCGMGSGRTQSKAESRSVATSRKPSPPRSNTSRTLPERSLGMPGRSSVEISIGGHCRPHFPRPATRQGFTGTTPGRTCPPPTL